MVERRTELKRRYHRKAKMRKLKTRLAQAKSDGDRSKYLTKIKMLSPFWTPPGEGDSEPAKDKPAKTEKPKRAPKKS